MGSSAGLLCAAVVVVVLKGRGFMQYGGLVWFGLGLSCLFGWAPAGGAGGCDFFANTVMKRKKSQFIL